MSDSASEADDPGKRYGDARRAALELGLVEAVGANLLALPDERLSIGAGRRVIVVGGGFAGLASGCFLDALGFDVVVYEASERPGGRVWTNRDSFVSGRDIEFGAELIGWNHAVWRGLARSLGLRFAMLTSSDADDDREAGPWDLGGEIIVGEAARALRRSVDAVVGELAVLAEDIWPYRPWDQRGDGVDPAALDHVSLGAWLDQRAAGHVRAGLEILFSNDNVRATHEQGLLGALAQIAGGGCQRFDPDTEVMRCADGNDALALRLVDRLGDRVHFNEPVRSIAVGPDGVVATARSRDEADFVVVAVPPTMYATDASPGLEIVGLETADYRISLGPAVKHFARLASRVWKLDDRGPEGMSTEIGETWDATNSASSGPYELSLFAGGPAADRAVDAQRHGDHNADDFYGPNLRRLFPHYEAEETRFVAWPDEPWIRCGYSALGVGELANAKRLSRPFARRVVFAGEHTCPAFYGYMEGALESGLLAADQILTDMDWYAAHGKAPKAIRLALEAACEAGTERAGALLR